MCERAPPAEASANLGKADKSQGASLVANAHLPHLGYVTLTHEYDDPPQWRRGRCCY